MPEIMMPPYPEKDEKRAEKLIKGILNGRIEPQNVPKEEAYLLYRKDVIEAIIESMKKHGHFPFLCHFGKDLGQPFIEIVKESTISYYSKYPVNPVDIVWKLAGAAENEWYLSLVDKYTSPQVKASLIEALQGSADNVEVLIRIYKKGKAAEKRAALEALAKLNPPEAEPIFKKIIEKGDRVNLIRIMDSEGPVYEAYRRERLKESLEDLLTYGKREDAEAEEICDKYHTLREYLRYNTEEEAIFLQIARAKLRPIINYYMNAELWYQCRRGKSQELIRHLYEAEPKLFDTCYALCKFSDGAEDCYEVMAGLSALHRKDFLGILGWLEYAPYRGIYHTKLFEVCPFEILPDEFLDFLCDDSYLMPTEPDSEERLYVLEAVDKICWALYGLSVKEHLAEGDRERVTAAMEEFVRKVVRNGYVTEHCMSIVKKNPAIVQGLEKGLMTGYFYNMCQFEKNSAFQMFHEIDCLDLSKKDKLKELNALLRELCAKHSFTAQDLQRIRQTAGMRGEFKKERPVYNLMKAIDKIEEEPDKDPRSIFTVLEGGLGKLFGGKKET